MKVLAEDTGSNYNNENVFALKCPSCENVLIVADENEIDAEDPNSEDILKAFHEEYDFVSDIFNLNYCQECEQRLEFKNE